MTRTDRNALLAFPIVILIAAGVAVAGSPGGAKATGIPVFALCVALAFVIQWLAFIRHMAVNARATLFLSAELARRYRGPVGARAARPRRAGRTHAVRRPGW